MSVISQNDWKMPQLILARLPAMGAMALTLYKRVLCGRSLASSNYYRQEINAMNQINCRLFVTTTEIDPRAPSHGFLHLKTHWQQFHMYLKHD